MSFYPSPRLQITDYSFVGDSCVDVLDESSEQARVDSYI